MKGPAWTWMLIQIKLGRETKAQLLILKNSNCGHLCCRTRISWSSFTKLDDSLNLITERFPKPSAPCMTKFLLADAISITCSYSSTNMHALLPKRSLEKKNTWYFTTLTFYVRSLDLHCWFSLFLGVGLFGWFFFWLKSCSHLRIQSDLPGGCSFHQTWWGQDWQDGCPHPWLCPGVPALCMHWPAQGEHTLHCQPVVLHGITHVTLPAHCHYLANQLTSYK